MKLERIKKNNFCSTLFLKTFKKSYFSRFSTIITILKYALPLLLIFSFTSFNEETPLTFKEQESTLQKIAQIINPNERAVEWLIYLTELGINNPSSLKDQLKNVKELWPNDYKHKGAITILTKAEIDQIKGFDKKTLAKVETSVQLLESSETLSIEEKRILCLSYIIYTRVSKHIQNEKKGLEYGYKAINIANDINFSVGKIFAHNQVAELLGYTQNDLQLVLDHFIKAKIQIDSAPINIQNLYSDVININITTAWSELGEIEKAINARLELLEGKKKIINTQAKITLNNALGFDYYKLKKFDFAEKYLLQAIKLMNEENSLKVYKGIPFIRLGLIKVEQQEIAKATSYTDSIDHWLKSYNFLGFHKISYFHLKSKLSKANNDLEKSVYWLEKAIEERDSLSKIIGPNKIIKLEEQSKFSEIQREKIVLEKQRDLTKSTINNQKILIYAAIIVLMLVGFFLGRLHQQRNSIDKTRAIALRKEELQNKPTKESALKIIDQELMQKIEIALRDKKIYLSQDLTLKKFADYLDSNTSYLSKTINDGFQKNFNALINAYRIEEILRLFEEGEHQTFTIESIYQKAGFKSKSSFQKAFKAKTGQTASLYLNNLKSNRSQS